MTAAARARWVALAPLLLVVVGLIATDHAAITLRVGEQDGSGENAATGVRSDSLGGDPTNTDEVGIVGAGVDESGVVAGTTGAASSSGGSAPTGASPAAAAAPGETSSGPAEAAAQTDPAAAEVCKDGALKATDRGVTDTTIKLGFVTVSGITDDHKKALEEIPRAWIQEVNANGGVCGRKLEYVLVHSTYADEAEQLAACKELVLDQKVFAVIAYASYNTSAGQMCVAKDNQTPLLSWDQLPSHYYSDAAPFLWLSRLDATRMLKNFARTIVERGYIDKSKKVGVLYEGTPFDSEAVEKDLLPELARLGIKPAKVYKSSPSLEQSVNQMPDAVLQMKTAGVTHLMFVASVITKQQFIRHADSQQYYPRLLDHDIKDGCGELLHEFAAPYPDRSFEGTICVTAHFTGIAPDNQTSQFGEWIHSPFAKYADEVYKRWNKGGYEAVRGNAAESEVGFNPGTQRFLNYIVGGHLAMWKSAAERAGRNLTRARWGEAMLATGRFEQTAFAPFFTFGKGKADGPDQIRVVQFKVDASDGYERRKFRPIVPFFPVYY